MNGAWRGKCQVCGHNTDSHGKRGCFAQEVDRNNIVQRCTCKLVYLSVRDQDRQVDRVLAAYRRVKA